MATSRKITVQVSHYSYALLRQRTLSSDHKTSRSISKYLCTFLTLLEEGEQTLYFRFSPDEAKILAKILLNIKQEDEMTWNELCTLTADGLCNLIALYAPSESAIAKKVADLTSCEVLAFIEYAQIPASSDKFEEISRRFKA